MTIAKNDWATVAAIGLMAMCLVTFDHEAMGHGGTCLALHGRILALSSSVFRCDLHTGLIDAAGPASNIVCGLLALVLGTLVSQRAIKLRLFLIVVTAFSLFWEGGYLVQAMIRQHGDSYFFLEWWLGRVALWQRVAAAAAGVALYVFAVRRTSAALRTLWPEGATARGVARTVWLSATIGAALAALAYAGGVEGDLRDAVLEIGAASLPLLFVRNQLASADHPAAVITRSYPVIAAAGIVFVVFVATLGRGLA